MGHKAKAKAKETKKVIQSCADALEAALDHVQKLQIVNNQLESELADCEGREPDFYAEV